MTSGLDTLFVTALQLERRAMRQHLTERRSEQFGSLSVDIGRLGGEPTLEVGIVEVGVGNVDASAWVTQAIGDLHPRNVVMVGVAAGLKDVQIGDVVASSKVYWVEGGKEGDPSSTRPDFGPPSQTLVQRARAVAADEHWRERAQPPGSGERIGGSAAAARIAPVAVGEKVLASLDSEVVRRIGSSYSDAIAVEMEGFGVMRAAAMQEGVRAIVVRGISDLIAGKAEAEKAESQPVAAANAAGFAVELIATLDRPATPAERQSSEDGWERLHAVAVTLYPAGPRDGTLWERAGGDVAQLKLGGSGVEDWWNAVRALRLGGGGDVSLDSILRVMKQDFPRNDDLSSLIRRISPGR